MLSRRAVKKSLSEEVTRCRRLGAMLGEQPVPETVHGEGKTSAPAWTHADAIILTRAREYELEAGLCFIHSISGCVSSYRQWPQTLYKIRGRLGTISLAAFLHMTPLLSPHTLACSIRGFKTPAYKEPLLPGRLGVLHGLGAAGPWERGPWAKHPTHLEPPLRLALHLGSAHWGCPVPSAQNRSLTYSSSDLGKNRLVTTVRCLGGVSLCLPPTLIPASVLCLEYLCLPPPPSPSPAHLKSPPLREASCGCSTCISLSLRRDDAQQRSHTLT